MARRIDRGVVRSDEIVMLVDHRPLRAFAGETVATALLAAGISEFRASPRSGEPRGPFCYMGSCQECLVRIDGRRCLACQTSVAEGMQVETAFGNG